MSVRSGEVRPKSFDFQLDRLHPNNERATKPLSCTFFLTWDGMLSPLSRYPAKLQGSHAQVYLCELMVVRHSNKTTFRANVWFTWLAFVYITAWYRFLTRTQTIADWFFLSASFFRRRRRRRHVPDRGGICRLLASFLKCFSSPLVTTGLLIISALEMHPYPVHCCTSLPAASSAHVVIAQTNAFSPSLLISSPQNRACVVSRGIADACKKNTNLGNIGVCV